VQRKIVARTVIVPRIALPRVVVPRDFKEVALEKSALEIDRAQKVLPSNERRTALPSAGTGPKPGEGGEFYAEKKRRDQMFLPRRLCNNRNVRIKQRLWPEESDDVMNLP
jgi:hypothetical protein